VWRRVVYAIFKEAMKEVPFVSGDEGLPDSRRALRSALEPIIATDRRPRKYDYVHVGLAMVYT
jgi:hypothetical protein